MNRKKILIPIIIFTVLIIIVVILLNTGTRYKKLSVNQSKWDSIINSRSENNNLTLESIKFNDYKLIIDESNSILYYSVVNDNRTKYNPDVSFSTAEEKVKLAILKDEITSEKITGNYVFKLIIYNNSQYHIYKLICIDFPILNISYNEKDQERLKNIQVDMYLFNNLSSAINRITRSRGKLDILEDEEYKLSLNMMSPGKNKRKNNISLLNMSQNNEYMLYLANNGTSSENGQHVELFINNKYVGLYLLVDNMRNKIPGDVTHE